MTHLVDLYDPIYKQMDDEYAEQLATISKQIFALPNWRWLRRSNLNAQFRDVQRKMGYLRDEADQEVRDRLLRNSAGLPGYYE